MLWNDHISHIPASSLWIFYVCPANLIKGAAVVGGLFVFPKISWCGLKFPSYLHFLSLSSGKASLQVCCSLVIFNDSFIFFLLSSLRYTPEGHMSASVLGSNVKC